MLSDILDTIAHLIVNNLLSVSLILLALVALNAVRKMMVAGRKRRYMKRRAAAKNQNSFKTFDTL